MAVLSPLSRRVFLTLLREPPNRPLTARAIATASGASRHVVNEVLRFLEFHNAIEPRPAGRLAWRRVADLAGDLRLPTLVPARTVSRQASLEGLAAGLSGSGIEHCFAFTTAANRWAFFEPDPDLHVVVAARDIRRAEAAVRAGADPGDPGVRRVRLYVDDLGALDITSLRGLSITSRLQTWIDLRRFPHAGAHAAFFESVIRQEFPEAATR